MRSKEARLKNELKEVAAEELWRIAKKRDEVSEERDTVSRQREELAKKQVEFAREMLERAEETGLIISLILFLFL